jgi:hypothetical protein
MTRIKRGSNKPDRASIEIKPATKPKKRNSPEVISKSGRVKIYLPTGKKQYRLTYFEDGKQRDTTAQSLTHAMEVASLIEKRLLAKHGDRSLLSVSEMIAKYLDPDENDTSRGEWGDSHRVNVENAFRKSVLPFIGTTTCADLTSSDLSDLVLAQETTSNADHLARYLNKLINWAFAEEWVLVEPKTLTKGLRSQVKKVTKKVGGEKPGVAGESKLKVSAGEIPGPKAVRDLGIQAAKITGVWWHELHVNLAAYSGLRLGESFDLDIDHINLAKREISVETQKIEVRGKMKQTPPKWNTTRKTVYPIVTPGGYNLHEMMVKRVGELKKLKKENKVPELQDGSHRLLMFPSEQGGWQSGSNYGKRIRRPAQEAAGWPKDEKTNKFIWTHHSLRHVFCSFYIFDRKADVRDVSIAAGHKSYTTTMDMYVGQSGGALDRLRKL